MLADDDLTPATRRVGPPPKEPEGVRWRALVEHAGDLLAILDADGTNRYASPSHQRVLGIAPEALEGRNCFDLVHPDDAPTLRALFAEAMRTPGPTAPAHVRFLRVAGGVCTLAVTLTDMRAEPAVAGIVANSRDRTAELETEARLHQAQKMEAVGQLAGAVAHDFNNLLTVVIASVDLALFELDADASGASGASAPPAGSTAAELRASLRDLLADIRLAGDRAARLTRQLLAFSRRQVLQPQRLWLGEMVQTAVPMIRRLTGESVTVDVHLAEGAAPLVMDSTQLTQVLLNLASNARDAMRESAERRLTIVATEAVVEHGDSAGVARMPPDCPERLGPVDWPGLWRAWRPGLSPGRYGVLVVADTGHGMSEEARAHAFEPFYTTKRDDEGTGLGLATCYGIVRQSRGQIYVDTEPGVGTAFVIYLPVPGAEELARATTVSASPRQRLGPALAGSPARGARRGAVVLLAEDDPEIRRAARRILAAHGDELLEAADGQEALELWEVRRGGERPVDVVLSDLFMPRLGGLALVERVRAGAPGLPVVLMSGYIEGEADPPSGLPDGAQFVEKPFSAASLLAAVERALELAPDPRDG
jgi:PAS domain S-box-containing protein